jgi:predicted N-acyltransferase
MKVERVTSIAEIAPADWEAVSRGRGLYMSRAWLAAVEQLERPGTEVSYLLVRQRGTLVAAMPLYWRDRPPQDHFYDAVDQFVVPTHSGGAAEARREWYPFLLGGSTAAYWNELLVHPGLPPAERDRATAELLAAFDRERGPHGAALMWLAPDGTATVRHRPDFAGRLVLSGAQTTLDVRWPDFSGYLGSLSQGRSSMVRREVNKFGRWTARRTRPALADCADRLVPLIANLQRRYAPDADESRLSAQLAAQAQHLGDAAVVFACEQAEGIVAFALGYVHENELFMRSVGFDYEHTEGTFAYFNLTYYEPIRYAIEHNLKRIHLGLGTYNAKMVRGARLTPSWSVAFAPRTASDLTVKALAEVEATSVSRLTDKHEVNVLDGYDDLR